MKPLKILPLLIFSIFLISSASALIVVDSQWENGLQSTTITQGESIDFDVYFTTHDVPMNVKVELFKIEGSNEIFEYSFIDSSTDDNFFKYLYTISEARYKTFGKFKILISGTDNTYNENDPSTWEDGSDEVTLYLTVKTSSELDTENPEIVIISPEEKIYSSYVTSLNYEITDNLGLDFCKYSTNNGQTKYNLDCNGNTISLNSVEGQNTWTIYATDLAGNTAEKNVTFIVDLSGEYPQGYETYDAWKNKMYLETQDFLDAEPTPNQAQAYWDDLLEIFSQRYGVWPGWGLLELADFSQGEIHSLITNYIDSYTEPASDKDSPKTFREVGDNFEEETYLNQFETKTVIDLSQTDKEEKEGIIEKAAGLENKLIWTLVILILVMIALIILVAVDRR